jgi:uncharacterized protein YbaR (Trm112 family)
MLLELSEVLACPGCGPPQVMVAVVHESAGHRVGRGFLGCPACDSRFSIDEGVVYLGQPESAPSPGHAAAPPGVIPEEGALLVGAVLDLARGNGYVLLGPELLGIVDEVAALAGGWEVVSLARVRRDAPKSTNVSRIVWPRIVPLPVLRSRFGAAALAGEQEAGRIQEFANAIGPLGRLAIVAPRAGAVEAMREAGLEVIAADERVAVATRRS